MREHRCSVPEPKFVEVEEMRKVAFPRKAKWYITVIMCLMFALLLLSLRWVSQIGNVVLMDAEVARSPFGRFSPAHSEKVHPHQPVAQQPHRNKPLYWCILLSLTDAEVEQPVDIGEGCLPASLDIYETRAIAGKDLAGYTVSVTSDSIPVRSVAIPVPFFQLSRVSAKTALRKVTLLAMSRRGDLYAANVGLLSPHLRDVRGWSAPTPKDFHLVSLSVPNEKQKRYRWAAFVPAPVYQRIRFCDAEVRAYAFYRTAEQAGRAALRLWDVSGNMEVVEP